MNKRKTRKMNIPNKAKCANKLMKVNNYEHEKEEEEKIKEEDQVPVVVAEGGRRGEGGGLRVDGVFFAFERVGRQCPEVGGAEEPGFITVKERTAPPHVTAAGPSSHRTRQKVKNEVKEEEEEGSRRKAWLAGKENPRGASSHPDCQRGSMELNMAWRDRRLSCALTFYLYLILVSRLDTELTQSRSKFLAL